MSSNESNCENQKPEAMTLKELRAALGMDDGALMQSANGMLGDLVAVENGEAVILPLIGRHPIRVPIEKLFSKEAREAKARAQAQISLDVP